MELNCIRCAAAFDAPRKIGYCPDCIQHFADVRDGVHARQRPAPGVICDGKFADEKECPQTIESETGRQACGLCGSEEVEAGYGLGSGHGMGCYNFCTDCNSFLDFSEDRE